MTTNKTRPTTHTPTTTKHTHKVEIPTVENQKPQQLPLSQFEATADQRAHHRALILMELKK